MKLTQLSLLCLILISLVASCASTEDGVGEELWAETSVKAPSVDVLWRVTELALNKEQLPVQAQFDPSTRVATTGWAVSLAPFKGRGFRERAQVRYEALGEGEFAVSTRIIRETNESLARPLDISYAKWEPSGDNESRARILLQRIRAYLGDESEFEVGPKRSPFN